jgi:anthranilate synthase component II
MHGKTSMIEHNGEGIFAGLPNPLEVARYHSLIVDRATLPPELEILAWTDEPGFEDEIQAFRHSDHPVWGVQFHPESIASQGGRELMSNFLKL